ncbi:MAG: hypothetical protein AB1401_00555 [Thermodesulfobacteriota bacterium]
MAVHWGYVEKRLADGKIVGWICSPKPPEARKGYDWVEVEDQPVVEGETLLVRDKKVGERVSSDELKVI